MMMMMMMMMMMNVLMMLVELMMTMTMTTMKAMDREFWEQTWWVWDTVGFDLTTRVPDAV